MHSTLRQTPDILHSDDGHETAGRRSRIARAAGNVALRAQGAISQAYTRANLAALGPMDDIANGRIYTPRNFVLGSTLLAGAVAASGNPVEAAARLVGDARPLYEDPTRYVTETIENRPTATTPDNEV